MVSDPFLSQKKSPGKKIHVYIYI